MSSECKILDEKSNRMSRANLGMFEADLSASLPNLQRILDFLSLKNFTQQRIIFLLSNKLFLWNYYNIKRKI